MPDPTRICPLCAETIKAAARICPFCQTRLSPWGVWGPALPPLIVVVFLGAGVFALDRLFPDALFLQGRAFARHRSELGVVRLSYDRGHGASAPWLSGFVTNRSAHPWRVHQLEVQFLDTQSNVFDVAHLGVNDAFVVPPGREHAFRVSLGKLAWTNEAAIASARVGAATDGTLQPPHD